MTNKRVFYSFLSFAVILVLTILPGNSIFAQTNDPPIINEDKVVLGQNFTLLENQKLAGDLAIIGGTVRLSKNSTVNGDIALLGGVLTVEGTVNGDIQALGGTISLSETATINGSLYNFSSNLTQAEGAIISGQQIANLPFHFNFGNLNKPDLPQPLKTTSSKLLDIIGKFLFSILQIISLSALALLLVLIAPEASGRVANAIERQPFVQWGIGLLTSFAFPLGLLILILTIILIPIAFIAVFVITISLIFGWVGMGYAIGKRLFSNNKNKVAPALVAASGTLILSIIGRVVAEIPCIGVVLVFFVSLIGLGAVILTRFGTRDYLSASQKTPPAAKTSSSGMETPQIGSILADIDEGDYDDLEDFDDESSDPNPSDESPNHGGEL